MDAAALLMQNTAVFGVVVSWFSVIVDLSIIVILSSTSQSAGMAQPTTTHQGKPC